MMSSRGKLRSCSERVEKANSETKCKKRVEVVRYCAIEDNNLSLARKEEKEVEGC